jgi:hypothetical protein
MTGDECNIVVILSFITVFLENGTEIAGTTSRPDKSIILSPQETIYLHICWFAWENVEFGLCLVVDLIYIFEQPPCGFLTFIIAFIVERGQCLKLASV